MYSHARNVTQCECTIYYPSRRVSFFNINYLLLGTQRYIMRKYIVNYKWRPPFKKTTFIQPLRLEWQDSVNVLQKATNGVWGAMFCHCTALSTLDS